MPGLKAMSGERPPLYALGAGLLSPEQVSTGRARDSENYPILLALSGVRFVQVRGTLGPGGGPSPGCLTRLGFKDVSHHTLRHTGATVMLASGASLRAVQEIGGWTSLRMLERYAHPSDAEKRRAVDLAAVITETNPDQKVDTNAGTAPAAGESSDSEETRNALVGGELDWRPQGDSPECIWRGRWRPPRRTARAGPV